MLIVGFLGWWYGVGWLTLLRRVGVASQHVLQFFSVTELAGSLFAPFRQISAERVQGPLGIQLRAFGDRLFSRFFGAFIRTILIIFGLIVATLYGTLGLLAVVVWPFIIVLPIVGLALMLQGYAL